MSKTKMSEYIDVETLRKAVKDEGIYDINKDDVLGLISSLPTIDAVTVVRCSECAHSVVIDYINGIPCLACAKSGGQKVDYDGYCYKGEKAVVRHG